MSEYAPILVFVYDRCEHLKQCIAALLCNPEACDSILYVASDGPACKEHENAVMKVRAYIDKVDGFREVRKIYRDENWGSAQSCGQAFEQVLEQHGRSIVMEDDVICNKHYLGYMNQALDFYETDKRIFAIGAFSMPDFQVPKNYTHDVYLWSIFTGWGVGMWKDRYDCVDMTCERYRLSMLDAKVRRSFFRVIPDSGSLDAVLAGKLQAGDMTFSCHMFNNGLYMVYPVESLTKNIGADGSGLHSGKNRKLQNQVIKDRPINLVADIEPNPEIYRRLYWCRFSFREHVVGSVLRRLGLFDTVYAWYRRLQGMAAFDDAKSRLNK